MRYKCTVSYDGTNYHGFQTQDNLITIQEEIEKVLLIINKKKVSIHPSGRTDTGVHAVAQVFHFDSDINMREWNMKNAINSRLPKDIYITKVEKTDETFHARYNVLKKEYHYIINLGEYDPLKKNYMYFPRYKKLNVDKMLDALDIFIGEHDFKSFTKSGEKENTIRTIYDIKYIRDKDILTLIFVGNGFLHNMVRILVAMLLEVGWNNYTKNDLKHILEQKNRQLAPKIAPPNGLYLFKVYYDQ